MPRAGARIDRRRPHARPHPRHPRPLEWLGFIQPNGLVVSVPALVKAGAILNRRDGEGQGRLAACVRELDPAPCLPDFRENG